MHQPLLLASKIFDDIVYSPPTVTKIKWVPNKDCMWITNQFNVLNGQILNCLDQCAEDCVDIVKNDPTSLVLFSYFFKDFRQTNG